MIVPRLEIDRCPDRLGRRQRQLPDAPASNHGHPVAGSDLAPADAVHRDGQRLHQAGVADGDSGGERHDGRWRHETFVGHAAVAPGADQHGRSERAQVVGTRKALRA